MMTRRLSPTRTQLIWLAVPTFAAAIASTPPTPAINLI
jgi:hypothetical protein